MGVDQPVDRRDGAACERGTETLMPVAHAEKAQRDVLVAFDLLEAAVTALSQLPRSMSMGADALISEWVDEVQPAIRTMLDEVVTLARTASGTPTTGVSGEGSP